MELLICFVFQAAPLESVMRANIWKWVKYECFNRNLMDQRGNRGGGSGGDMYLYMCVASVDACGKTSVFTHIC